MAFKDLFDTFQGLFGDTKTGGKTTQLTPWGGTGNLGSINTGIGNNLLKPWTSYQGDWVADLNDQQMAGLDELYDYSAPGGAGRDVADTYSDYGTDLAAGLTDSNQFYGDVMSGDKVLNEGPDMAMVAMMADNPYMNGMIDAANRDTARDLYENQMPGIAASSAMSGNLGSSRRGAAEAIAERGANDRMADTSASMRGSAYERALGLESQRSEFNAGRQLSAADRRAGMGEYGIGLIGQGDERMRQAMGDMVGVGTVYQGQEQRETDALRQAFDQDQQRPMDQLRQAYDMTFPQEEAFGEYNEVTTDTENVNLIDFFKNLFNNGTGSGEGGGEGGGEGDGENPGTGETACPVGQSRNAAGICVADGTTTTGPPTTTPTPDPAIPTQGTPRVNPVAEVIDPAEKIQPIDPGKPPVTPVVDPLQPTEGSDRVNPAAETVESPEFPQLVDEGIPPTTTEPLQPTQGGGRVNPDAEMIDTPEKDQRVDPGIPPVVPTTDLIPTSDGEEEKVEQGPDFQEGEGDEIIPESGDPIEGILKDLIRVYEKAIQDGDYEYAAKILDEIKKIKGGQGTDGNTEIVPETYEDEGTQEGSLGPGIGLPNLSDPTNFPTQGPLTGEELAAQEAAAAQAAAAAAAAASAEAAAPTSPAGGGGGEDEDTRESHWGLDYALGKDTQRGVASAGDYWATAIGEGGLDAERAADMADQMVPAYNDAYEESYSATDNMGLPGGVRRDIAEEAARIASEQTLEDFFTLDDDPEMLEIFRNKFPDQYSQWAEENGGGLYAPIDTSTGVAFDEQLDTGPSFNFGSAAGEGNSAYGGAAGVRDQMSSRRSGGSKEMTEDEYNEMWSE